MKKNLIIIILVFVCANLCKAQVNLNDFGRIILNTYLPDNNSIPAESKQALENKINQITTNNGMGGSHVNPRFVITASLNIGTKDIIAGPPQLIAQNVDVTLFIGDALTNTKLSNVTISLKGVGSNENKAIIDALKTLYPKNKEVDTFLEEGKNKIISYYAINCDFIIKDANSLAEQFKLNEAIYKLMAVPDVCKDCYFKAKDLSIIIFKKKIESDCTEKVREAKLIWAAEPNEKGALNASAVMTTIIPSIGCSKEITKLSEDIKKHLKADQQKKYDFEMLAMKKKYDTEQKRLDGLKAIALEQAKNQPKTVTYNNIYWR